jgi:hypothetical protein
MPRQGQTDPARQAGNTAADLFDDLAEGGERRDPTQQRDIPTTDPVAEMDQDAPGGDPTGLDTDAFQPPSGGTGETGFDEDYWRRKLGGGTGVSQSLGGGGNFFGTGPEANKDLEAILMDTGLPELDAKQLAAFAAAKQAQTMQAEKAFTEERDTLMEDMFGRGMQRSTVAGEAGGRMLEGRARTMAGIEAQDMMSRMQQQNVLAQRRQQGAAISGDIRGKFRAAQATEHAAASQANATRAMASAQVKSAEIAARSRMATTMAELDLKRELGLGDLALRGGMLDLERDKLDYSYWAKEGDWASAINQIKEQEPALWEKIAGFASAALSTKRVKHITCDAAPRGWMREKIMSVVLKSWRYLWDRKGTERYGLVIESAPAEFSNGPTMNIPAIVNYLIATVQLQQSEIDELKERA